MRFSILARFSAAPLLFPSFPKKMSLTPITQALSEEGDDLFAALVDEAVSQMGLQVSDVLGTPLSQDQMNAANNQLFALADNVYKRVRLSGGPVTSAGTRSKVSFTKKMKKKSVPRRKKPQTLAQKIKSISLRQQEIKNCNNGSSANLTHAEEQTMNITAAITQGTTNEQRTGDEIILNRLRLFFDFAAPATAGAYAYRVMVLWSTFQNSSLTFSTTGLQFVNVFLPGAVAGSNSMGIVNKKGVTVLYDGVVNINSNIAATADHVQFPIDVNLRNVKFPYLSTGSALGKSKNLYVFVIPFVIGGTVDTTGCGTVICNYSVDYRDA